MSEPERRLRSRLAQLVSLRGLIRGSLLVRRRVCGKPNCRCTRGQEHESLYLVIREGGCTRQICVPKRLEAQVRRWVGDYHAAREALEGISQLHVQKLRRREEE